MLVRLEAARRLLDRARFRPPRVVRRRLEDAVGSLVAEEVRARRDHPAAAVSAMDGFAVRSYRTGRARAYALLDGGRSALPAVRPLREGQATTVATGAILPPGADAVVRLEAARWDEARLRVHAPVRPGQDVIPRGESIVRGETIVERGAQLGPYPLNALLADGLRTLAVYDLRVSLLAVGDEIRGPGGRGPAGVTDTIGPVIGRVFDFARVRRLPPVGDRVSSLRRAIARELGRADLVVTIGGSSVGREDVTKRALSEMGELLFEGVTANVLKRGAVARVGEVPVLILPGQIVSAVTAAHEHGLHVLGRLAGRELRVFETARLSKPVASNHRMDSTYLFRMHDGLADPLPWGVARTAALLQANGFGVLPRGRRWAKGDRVELQRLRGR